MTPFRRSPELDAVVAAVDFREPDPHVFHRAGRQVLADEIGPQRELAVTPVDETASCTARGRPSSNSASSAARAVRPVKSTSSTSTTTRPEMSGTSVGPSGATGRSPMSSR